MNTRKVTLISVLIAIAIVLSIVDGMIPSPIPGMKLGLANVVILITLYALGTKEAILVNILRVYLGGLLRGTIFNYPFLMSLTGAFLSLLVMIILKHTLKKLSMITVSIVGSVFHCVGQILIAFAFLGTNALLWSYLAILALVAVGTGVLTGIVAKKIVDSRIIQKQRDKYNF